MKGIVKKTMFYNINEIYYCFLLKSKYIRAFPICGINRYLFMF